MAVVLHATGEHASVFGTHEPTQNRRHLLREGAIDAAIDRPVFAIALCADDGAALGAQHDLKSSQTTLVNIHRSKTRAQTTTLAMCPMPLLYARFHSVRHPTIVGCRNGRQTL